MAEPVIVKIVGSSRPDAEPHVIRRMDNGALFCNCLAGIHDQECWALRSVRADLEFQRLKDFALKLDAQHKGIKLPDMARLIKEQWSYIDQKNYERKEREQEITQGVICMRCWHKFQEPFGKRCVCGRCGNWVSDVEINLRK